MSLRTTCSFRNAREVHLARLIPLQQAQELRQVAFRERHTKRLYLLTVALILPTASGTVQHLGRRWLMGVALTLSGVWGLVFWLLGALAPELLALACGANLLVALALTRWNGRLYAQYCPTD